MNVILIFLIICLFPMTLIFWLFQVYTFIFHEGTKSDMPPISPFRIFLSFALPSYLIRRSLKNNSLSSSGAFLSFFVGFILTISNYCFMASMIAFFIIASKATKFRSKKKALFEEDFKEGGQRNWIQVFCNGMVATQISLFYLLEAGSCEITIDFEKHYNSSWLAISVLSSIACCCGDTLSSELGSVLGGEPYLITTLQKVPKGTNGGISLVGTLSSLLGGLIVGIGFYIAQLVTLSAEQLSNSNEQIYFILSSSIIAGFIGSLIDSLLGAIFQYSGEDLENGKIISTPYGSSSKVRHISGLPILDNHSVNLLSCYLTALIAPTIAVYMWKLF